MKIKELKRMINDYDENMEVYIEFPARYKAIDAERIVIKGATIDITPLVLTLAGEDKFILLTDT